MHWRTPLIIGLGWSWLITGLLHAQAYPARPVRLVVPYTPGGANDIFARLVLTRAVSDLGQITVVDNRPGGNTTIGTQLVARATPDGYTLLNVDNAYTIAPSVQPSLPYDTLKDFARITQYATTSPLLVVHPSLPANSVKALVALALAEPGKLNYGSTGGGTTGHLAFAQLRMVTGIDAVHVPYKGGAPQIGALIAGEVSMLISVPAPLLAHIKSGRIRALATTGAARLKSLPAVPTMQESGVAVVMDAFWGLAAPAGIRQELVKTLHEAVERVLKIPDLRARLEDMQFQLSGLAPAQFETFIESEINRWLRVAKATGVKID